LVAICEVDPELPETIGWDLGAGNHNILNARLVTFDKKGALACGHPQQLHGQ